MYESTNRRIGLVEEAGLVDAIKDAGDVIGF